MLHTNRMLVSTFVLFALWSSFNLALGFPVTTTTTTLFERQQSGQQSGRRRRQQQILPKMVSPDATSTFRLGYITDVEGNYEYFKAFVARSNVLDQLNTNDDDATKEGLDLSLRDGCYFVFGGDTVDKGPGDIRLCRALVSLKKKYPDRVFLLVGNRDLNKLRFTAELSDFDMERHIDEIPPPHWDPQAPTLRTHLEAVASSKGLASSEAANTRVERLKYMLLHTLGCPETFEYRREELALLKGNHPSSVTDEDVLESFLYEVEHPDGSLRQYLEHADVVALVGNTLFAHGAVDADTVRFVPRHDSRFENPSQKPPPGKLCDTVEDWVHSLNDYLRRGLADYQARPHWDTEHRVTRGGEALMALQNRPAMWGRSIVSNCYGDGGVITTDFAAKHRNDAERLQRAETDPLVFEKVSSDPMDSNVASWLLENGVRRVVVGHKPTGDCPAVLSSAYTGIEVVSADTSYSDVRATDNRGEALSVVEIVGESASDNWLEISGRLHDGEEYHGTFHRLLLRNNNKDKDSDSDNGIDEAVGDCHLGKKLQDGWWVKAATKDHYRLCRGKGRNVEFKTVGRANITALY